MQQQTFFEIFYQFSDLLRNDLIVFYRDVIFYILGYAVLATNSIYSSPVCFCGWRYSIEVENNQLLRLKTEDQQLASALTMRKIEEAPQKWLP